MFREKNVKFLRLLDTRIWLCFNKASLEEESMKLEPYVGEPDIQRLLAAFKRKKVDRVPNFEVLIEDQHVEKLLGYFGGNTLSFGGDPAKGVEEAGGARPMKSEDYLKYWRVVRYYIKKKYKLTTAELETLLFLKTEGRFSRDDFQKFNEVISWNKDRFEKLRRDGWIVVFRKRVGKRRALYELSYKTKRLIASVYSKLNGNEIPTSVFSNKKYTDKVYRNLIEQLRHPSPE